jgi:response regulator RpfG family c-di-GMP phosphodiesterase
MINDSQDIKILVIDDEQQILDLVCEILVHHGFEVISATNGKQGLELFEHEKPTVIMTDIYMPEITGIEILKTIKKISPVTQVIVFSGVGTNSEIIEALRLGACDYLVKPFNVGFLIHTVIRCIERHELIQERISQKETLEKMVRERTAALTKTFYKTVKALGLITEKRDQYTAGHQHRVALLAMEIGKKLGLSQKELETIHVAGLLHDIGKVAVPVELLAKPAKLTNTEIQLIRSHPQMSYDIIKDIPFVESIGKDVAIIVQQHHERLDGSGYPVGLTNNDLEMESKILSVSDVVEAMSSHRPYRAALDMTITKAEIANGSGRLYSPESVDACLQIIEENGNDNQKLFESLIRSNRNNK